MAKSAKQYIEENDFEGAKKRYDDCYVRWQEHWFDTCFIIAQKCREWFKKYVFDPINKTITEVFKREKKYQLSPSYVYLIRMFDEDDKFVFIKCGKTDDPQRRFKELSKYYYKEQNIKISRIEVIKIWELPNEHLAEGFESNAKAYFSNFLFHYRKDRFIPCELIKEDFEELERRYEMQCGLA